MKIFKREYKKDIITEYNGNNEMVDPSAFHDRIESIRGAKSVFHTIVSNTDMSLVYRYRDATIHYWISGKFQDDVQKVVVRVIGKKEKTMNKICDSIESNFPGLEQKILSQ